MSKLEGYIDLKTGYFYAKHKNMKIVVDFDNKLINEKIFVPEYEGNSSVKPDENAVETIWRNIIKKDSTWKLKDQSSYSESSFFYRSYISYVVPGPVYMDEVCSLFQWYFHKFDVYNINELPF